MIQSEQILQKTEELFLKYGIKSITMDDVARMLAISKKTLYQFFSDKDDLVSKTIKKHFEREKRQMDEINRNSKNAVEEMFAIGHHVTVHMRSMNPSAIYDLQKYHHKAWQMFLDYKNSFVHSCILRNITTGIKQGLYRNDVNADVIAKIYTAQIEVLVNPEIFPFPKYTFIDVYKEYLNYHIRAIASAKGHKLLEKQNIEQ